MINVIAFMIFGAALYVYASIGIAIDEHDFQSLKSDIRMWQWWVAMFIYMMFWPLIMAAAIYKAIHKVKSLSD